MKKGIWLTFLIILVSTVSIFVFWSTLQQALAPEKAEIQSGRQSSANVDEFIGMTIKIPGAEKNGLWELHVSKVESTDNIGELNTITGDYILNKKLIYQISGNSGTIYWDKRILKVTGDVILKTTDDTKILTATEIIWDPNIKNFKAQKNVVLKTPEITVMSDEINSSLDLDQVTLKGLTKIVYTRDVND